jgi:perosamine synthetase
VARPVFGVEEARAVGRVLASGWVAQGAQVAAFEERFAATVGAKEAVATSSCTAALHLALLLVGIAVGDEVIVPSLSFIASANVIGFVGARAVFADVDAATLNLTPETIEQVRTPRTRAVLVVHQAGTPADVSAIHAHCDPLGITVIEDAACAIGSTLRDVPIGSHSDLVAFSLHPRKVITTGEGGMVVTSRMDFAERARRLRSHGANLSDAARHRSTSPMFEQYVEPGMNYRMTDLQGAIGIEQLGRLSAIVERRRELAARYQAALSSVPSLRCTADPPYGKSNFQSFWVELTESHPLHRDDLLAVLYQAGIGARRGIMASHLEPAYAGHAHGPLPVTERMAGRTVILPLFHELTEDEQDHVIAVLIEAGRGRGRGPTVDLRVPPLSLETR